jgi:tuberous sclerosis protein 1
LNVREPHDKFLCDKITECIRSGGKSRPTALALLGFVVRKQPSWLYRITQHSLMKELLKVLKHEDDLVVMMSALMDLLVLMPMVPAYIAHFLSDLFEIFR